MVSVSNQSSSQYAGMKIAKIILTYSTYDHNCDVKVHSVNAGMTREIAQPKIAKNCADSND